MTINEQAKETTINQILSHYEKGWNEYDETMLLDQFIDFEDGVSTQLKNLKETDSINPKVFNKQELISWIIKNDRCLLNNTPLMSLEAELIEIKKVNY